MRHRQTIFAALDPDATIQGNCMQAAVATLLGWDSIEDVPHFCRYFDDPDHLWWYSFVGFAASLDPPQRVMCLDIDPRNPVIPERPCILSGKSPRGDWMHAMVYFGDGDWWDPHPDDTAIDSVVRAEWLEPWPT